MTKLEYTRVMPFNKANIEVQRYSCFLVGEKIDFTLTQKPKYEYNTLVCTWTINSDLTKEQHLEISKLFKT